MEQITNGDMLKMSKLKFCPDDIDNGELEEIEDYPADLTNNASNEMEINNVTTDKTNYDDWMDPTGVAINPLCMVTPAKGEDVMFDLCCGNCWEDSGVPLISCAHGHVICTSCFDKGIESCGTTIMDSPDSTSVCGAKFYGIDDAIKNTPYFKVFLESSRYECGLKNVGCDTAVPGNQIEEHELNKCAFRFVKYCGYHFMGCTATFQNIAENVSHMMVEHKLPVDFTPGAHFYVKYDRKEFLRSAKFTGVVPLIRGAVGAKDKHFLCLLMVEDLEDNKTRLWFVSVYGANRGTTLHACICIYPSKLLKDATGVHKGSLEANLVVIPEMKQMVDLQSTNNGITYSIILDNKELDKKYLIRKPGDDDKYFGMLIFIVEKDEEEEMDGIAIDNETEVGSEEEECDGDDEFKWKLYKRLRNIKYKVDQLSLKIVPKISYQNEDEIIHERKLKKELEKWKEMMRHAQEDIMVYQEQGMSGFTKDEIINIMLTK